MKIICISDTHGYHENLVLPDADLIIHAGDISKRGKKEEVLAFLDWFAKLDYKYKIFIAGNHDFFFENATAEEIKTIIPAGIIYLNDSGVEIEGFKIWGSPVQPWFHNWAFNRERGANIQKHWDLIPNDLDILITHGPAYGILDKTVYGDLVGCENLLNTIKTVKLKIHITGHIHEAYGQINLFGINFINASVLNVHYKLVNTPILCELDKRSA